MIRCSLWGQTPIYTTEYTITIVPGGWHSGILLVVGSNAPIHNGTYYSYSPCRWHSGTLLVWDQTPLYIAAYTITIVPR